MEDKIENNLLHKIKKLYKPFEITVAGISMNPILYEGDVVTIQPQENYIIGDIVVFTYKYGELIIHRLIDIQDVDYFCKGDNSFRLEDITKEQIIGKVIAVNRGSHFITIPSCSDEFIILSKALYRAFFKCGYDIEKTKKTNEYNEYIQLISSMLY